MPHILAQPAGELTQLWYGDTAEDSRQRPDSSSACVSSGGLALANQNLQELLITYNSDCRLDRLYLSKEASPLPSPLIFRFAGPYTPQCMQEVMNRKGFHRL